MGFPTAPSKILVTGANGYIAMWVIDTCLNSGYTVRASVRSVDKTHDLKNTFQNFVDAGKLEFVVVEDISQEGAFDTAVKGIDGIIHMASPVSFEADDPQDLIGPAVAGTLGILESGLKHSGVLQRIVYTSSMAAIASPPFTTQTTLNELDWNNVSVEEVERLGKHAHPIHKYCASKILSEKALWKFREEHRHKLSWDVTTINSPLVFGPVRNNINHPSRLNTTTKLWWDNVVADPPTPQSVVDFNCYVDVRDVALAHVLALKKPAAGGERIIISAGDFVWQDWLDITSRHHFPLKSHSFAHHQDGYLPKGFPDIERNRPLACDNSKGFKLLGTELKYRSMEETSRDVLNDYIAMGW